MLSVLLVTMLWAPQAQEEAAQQKKAPKAHTEVRLILKNGSKVRGVVRNNVFHEKPVGRKYVPCKPRAKGSGLRLWFVENTKSVVFYPGHMIARRDNIREMTDREFRILSEKMAKLALEQAEAGKRKAEEVLAQREADQVKVKEEAEAKKTAEETAKAEALAKKQAEREKKMKATWLDLLAKFPPEKGWGPEKLELIQKNKINLGKYPSKEEADFENNIEVWLEAYNWWKKEQERKAAEKKKKKEEAAAAKAGKV